MDEQNNKAPTELQDEQMAEITGGAFTGSTKLRFNAVVRWKCSNPNATKENATVVMPTGPKCERKSCPYSTTPLKWCHYISGTTKYVCKYFSTY